MSHLYAPTRDGSLTLSTAPTEEPLSTADAKTHLRVDHDDTYIAGLIIAARRTCERITRRALVTQTWTMTWPSFGYAANCGGRIIRLPRPPLQSVSSIVYRDTDNAQQTLDSSAYTVVTSGREKGFIELNDGETWPTVFPRADGVTATFVAGYGDAGDVPDDVLHAMKLLVGHWYENREDVTDVRLAPVPKAADYLLDNERVFEY